jgi:hypothetical protein
MTPRRVCSTRIEHRVTYSPRVRGGSQAPKRDPPLPRLRLTLERQLLTIYETDRLGQSLAYAISAVKSRGCRPSRDRFGDIRRAIAEVDASRALTSAACLARSTNRARLCLSPIRVQRSTAHQVRSRGELGGIGLGRASAVTIASRVTRFSATATASSRSRMTASASSDSAFSTRLA